MEQAIGMLGQIDRKQASRNVVVGALLGGVFGIITTVGIIAIFTLVSTNQFANFYLGCSFMVIGVVVLVRVHKRRGMISADQTKKRKDEAEAEEGDDEGESLLAVEAKD